MLIYIHYTVTLVQIKVTLNTKHNNTIHLRIMLFEITMNGKVAHPRKTGTNLQ